MHTDLSILLDYSGSMDGMREAVEVGFNHLIDEQLRTRGEAALSLYRFSWHHDFEIVVESARICDVPKFGPGNWYRPRGGATAFYSAICHTIDSVRARVMAMDVLQRPSQIAIACITDGLDNDSDGDPTYGIVGRCTGDYRKDQKLVLQTCVDHIRKAQMELGIHFSLIAPQTESYPQMQI